MTMTTETKNIYDVLPELIADVGKDKDLQREVENYLAEKHSMPRGTFIEFLANQDRAESTEEDVLAVFLNAVHEVSKDEKYAPVNYFAPKITKKISKYQFEKSERFELPYTIRNVLAFPSGRDFVTFMSYQELAALWNARIITYNFATQRLSKKKMNAKGKIIEKPDINTRSVKAITKLMQEGKYKPDTILLNILVDENSNINYDDGELTIGEGTTVNIVDGFHRLNAILNVVEEDPNVEGYIGVSIKYYPLEEAQWTIGQLNTVNRFDKTLVKHYKAETIGAQIAKDLMNIPELKNRISIKTSLDKKLNLLTNFAILSEAIEDVFQPENAKDRYDVTDVLKKFFGYLIPSFADEFIKNKNEVAKVSWINHHNMFVGFVVIAKLLYDKYGKDYPVAEIVRIMKGINFSKENSEINDLLTNQGKVNSNKVKSQIRKFFEDKVKELI